MVHKCFGPPTYEIFTVSLILSPSPPSFPPPPQSATSPQTRLITSPPTKKIKRVNGYNLFFSDTVRSGPEISTGTYTNTYYRIALVFRGSLILRISRIWNRSPNLFNENLSQCALTPMGNTNSQNLFNQFLQSSYSRKFRPAKYKRYTVCSLRFTLALSVPK